MTPTAVIAPLPGSAFASFGTSAIRASVLAWIQYLSDSGQLSPGAIAPPKPAASFKANVSGDLGNLIQVTIANIQPDPAAPDDPTQTTFDLTISAAQSFASLVIAPAGSATLITTVLGVDNGVATEPGLGWVKGPGSSCARASGAGTSSNTAAAGASATVTVPNSDATATAFELVSRWQSGTLRAVVSKVDAANQAFSLDLQWSRALPGLTIGTLNTASGDEVTVTIPANAGVPQRGTVQLRGGIEAQPASTACGTAYSSE